MTFQSDQAFGALASRLIERGMIERVPGPGRAVRHKLTSKGEATLRKGYDMVDQVFEASFSPLTIRQREEFYRLLSRALIEGNPPQRVGL